MVTKRSEADECVICGYSFAAEWPRQCRKCGDYVCLSCLDEDGLCEFCAERMDTLDEIQ